LSTFVSHAAAEIEYHAYGNGYVFGGKGDHFLLIIVFEGAKLSLEAGDEAIIRVGDGDVYQGQIDIGVNHFSPAGGPAECLSHVAHFRWGCVRGASLFASLGDSGEWLEESCA
jgi:hypothetical protein